MSSANLAIQSIYDIINMSLDQFVPFKRVDTRSKSPRNKYPYAIERLLRKKATAWRVYSTFKTSNSLSAYKGIANKCKSAISKFVDDYESQLASMETLVHFIVMLIRSSVASRRLAH